VALEFFEILDELMPSIERVGAYFRSALENLARKHSFVKEVRGRGLMIGVELEIPGKQIVLDAMAKGLLINCMHDTVLRFLPPYIVTEKEVDSAVKTLSKLFANQKTPSLGEAVLIVERAFQAGHVGIRADVFMLRCASRRMSTHLDVLADLISKPPGIETSLV